MTQPRHHTPRSDLPTRGGQAAGIARLKGWTFLPWQQLALDVVLEYHTNALELAAVLASSTVPEKTKRQEASRDDAAAPPHPEV